MSSDFNGRPARERRAILLASAILGLLLGTAEASPPPGPAPSGGSVALAPSEKTPDLVKVSSEQIEGQGIGLARIASGRLRRHLLLPGVVALDAGRVAQVPARVVGTVAEMRKRLGDPAAAGEVVAVLDSREVADAKSEYLTASVDLGLQKTLYDRSKILWDRRVTPETQYLQTSNAFSQATLRVDLARQKLNALGIDADEVTRAFEARVGGPGLRRYELKAPIAGRIIARKTDVGSAVGKEGEPSAVYAIADLASLWVEIQVPQRDLAEVREGASVLVDVPGTGARRSEAAITFVDPTIDPETRNARVIASMARPDASWRPGVFVEAEIDLAEAAARPLAPKGAVQTIDGKPKLFVRTPDGFQAREVRLGASDDRSVEILSGVADGDEVAVANAFLLKAELGKSDAEGD